MKITASKLRQDIYNILDRVLESGEPIEIVRDGKSLKIVPQAGPSKRSKRKRHRRVMVGNPEDFVHIDWLQEWSESK